MPSTGDPYAVLGVARDATPPEITAAYERRLAAAAQAGDLQAAKRVDAAWEILRSPARRDEYDRTGRVVEVPRLPVDERYLMPRAVPFRAAPTSTAGNRRGRRRRSRGAAAMRESVRTVASVLLVLAVLLAGWRTGLLQHRGAQAVADVWRSSGSTAPPDGLHLVAHPHRLLPAVAGPRGVEPYALATSARFDPCRPIHYVVSGVPPFADGPVLLQRAVATVSADTGLRFVDDGPTSEPATPNRPPLQDRYGDRWAPVLVAWTDPSAIPRLGGDVVGLGGPSGATVAGAPQLVSGVVYLDTPALTAIRQRVNGALEVRDVMLHELGHLVGLQHDEDRTSVMYPTLSPLAPRFSARDLATLAVAGQGRCAHLR